MTTRSRAINVCENMPPEFAAGGKPSTRLPPGELVEQLRSTTKDNTHRTSMQTMKPEKCKHCILIRNVTAMDMKDCISVCEIVIYEVLASQNVIRARVFVHARCIGAPVPG